MKVKLSKEYDLDGKMVKEIELNFADLTGKDILDAEQTTVMIDNQMGNMLELSKAYQINIAAKASGIPAEELKKLNLADFTKLTMEVQANLSGF